MVQSTEIPTYVWLIETPLPSVYLPKSAGHQPGFGKGCDIINSAKSREPVLSDSLSQVLETLWYLDALSDFSSIWL